MSNVRKSGQGVNRFGPEVQKAPDREAKIKQLKGKNVRNIVITSGIVALGVIAVIGAIALVALSGGLAAPIIGAAVLGIAGVVTGGVGAVKIAQFMKNRSQIDNVMTEVERLDEVHFTVAIDKANSAVKAFRTKVREGSSSDKKNLAVLEAKLKIAEDNLKSHRENV